MRFAAWIAMIAMALVTPTVVAPAWAQTAAPASEQKQPPAAKAETKAKSEPKAAATGKTTKKAAKKAAKSEASTPTATPAQREAYAALSVAERLAIQSDLIWSGDLSGSLDPDFGDRAIGAVRAFQRRNAAEDTGILTSEQRQTLSNAGRSRKTNVGWQLVEDDATPGVRLGIPQKLVPRTEVGNAGTRWSSARGEIQIETFREKMAGASLNELFDELKRKPTSRRLESSAIQGNAFSISGMQGQKKFHVRAVLKDNEARGVTILYDLAVEGMMLPMVDTMANTFLPFGDPATASTARKVQYGSGIVVTPAGHVVTDRQLTDNCQSIVVAGLGRADTIASDSATALALLQVNGARNAKTLPFTADAPKSADLILLGVAAPETQNGAREVTSSSAKLRGVEGSRVLLDARPARGFAGGAALDGQGQFVGMIAAANAGADQSSFIPTSTIRRFLDGAGVYPVSGKSDTAAAKNAIVRVVCVRK